MTENIIVFDLETTGLDKQHDHIIQFAGLKINVSTNKVIDTLNLYIQPRGSYTISLGSYFKVGITPDFLKDKPHMDEVADDIVAFFGNDDVLGYNCLSFDIPFLVRELNECGRNIDFMNRGCYDAFLEEKRRNGNTLGEVYQRYAGKTMEDAGLKAHDALADIKATYSVFYAQQKQQRYNPEDMLCIDGVIKNMEFQGKEEPCFSVGKYRGVSVAYIAKVDIDYLKWIVSDKCGFSQSTKDYIKKYI